MNEKKQSALQEGLKEIREKIESYYFGDVNSSIAFLELHLIHEKVVKMEKILKGSD